MLKGISKFHSLQPLENDLIRSRTYSIQSTWEDKGLKEQSDTDFEESLSDLSEDIQSEDEKDLEDEESDFNEMPLVYTSSDDGRTSTGQGERNNAQGSDTDEMPDDVDVSKPSEIPKSIPPMSEKDNINVEVGLPDGILPLFNGSIKFQLPHHPECYVSAILDGSIKFQGASLISNEDLKALHGVPLPKNSKENWLSNFVIDEYLCVLTSESVTNGTFIKTLSWETFEKGVGIVPSNRIVEDAKELLLQDAVLVPCNEPKCEHWTLLAVLPKKKLVLCLDSLAADVVTPTSYRAVSKMASLIKELDKSTDTTQWQLVVNTKDDIKQQANGYDCGIFTCLYARCLVSKGSMIDVSSMHSFRQLMLLDLHQRRLHSLPLEGIQLEQYYAVDYVSNYYIRIVLHH